MSDNSNYQRASQIHRRRITENKVRWSQSLRLICCLSLSCVLVLSGAGVPAYGQTGPRPGAQDPLGPPSRYTLFPSDDLIAFTRVDGSTQLRPYRADPNLSLGPITGENTGSVPTDANQIVATSGRILTPDKEQVAFAQRAGQNLAVLLRYGGSNFSSYLLSGLADRLVTNLSNSVYQSADFADIAAADLDQLPDADGNNHDEVIVAYASPAPNNQLTIKLAVLDYTSPPVTSGISPGAVTTATLSHAINGTRLASPNLPIPNNILPFDNVLAVATGDFDGDGQNEIAVLSLQDGQTSWLTAFRYTNDGQGNRSLKEVSSVADRPSETYAYMASVDLTAGDFNGDGKDELIAHRLLGNLKPSIAGELLNMKMGFAAVQSDAALNLKYAGRYLLDTSLGDPSSIIRNNWQQFARVQLVSGLFKSVPAGDSLRRRQFVAAWNPTANYVVDEINPNTSGLGEICVVAFEVSDDLQTISRFTNVFELKTPDGAPPNQRFSIAAGKYNGNDNILEPLWSLTALTWSAQGAVTLSMLSFNSAGIASAGGQNLGNTAVDNFARMPVVAADLEGQSVYLGAPVHLTVENVVNTDFVLQEPPKHAFYDNRPTIMVNNQPAPNPSYGQVITVSRYDTFNVALRTSKGTTFSGKSTDTSNYSIGGSAALSAGATVKVSALIGASKASVDVTAKVGYDYTRNKESYNSNYSSRTVTQTAQTDHDDKLLGRLQIFDIWRYRVYGLSVTDQQNNSVNAFYEVILPGPTIPFDAGGLDMDWYQPVYENGNILSYPTASDQTFTPPDLGAYRIPCPANTQCNDDGTSTVNEPMVKAQRFSFGGTSGSFSLDYTNTTGSGNTVTTSHTITESLDVKLAYKGRIGTKENNVTIRASADFEGHSSSSLATAATSDTSTTSDTGITVNRSSGDSSNAYAFYPVFYATQDGTIKVSHAVSNPADMTGNPAAFAFWAGLYGRKPDLALNLPQRFSAVYGPDGPLVGWGANLTSLRKRMRGFFLRRAALNPVTNDYDLLAAAPAAGDQVRIEARVYNYSTARAALNAQVSYQLIGYDSDEDTEISFSSCPNGGRLTNGRCEIGTDTVALDPLQMTTSHINWDTTGFGGDAAGSLNQYRVYVVLDPGNSIDETYETENLAVAYPCKDVNGNPCTLPTGLDPGQNNEGYGYVTVAHPSLSATPTALLEADVSLCSDAIAARDQTGGLKTNNVPAQLNRPLSLRVSVCGDRPHHGIGHLLVYDGDPQKGGELIAGKLIHTGRTEGSSVWFDWIPRKLGGHQIYAVVLERGEDAKKGNNVASMTVNVASSDVTPPALEVTLTPHVLWPADGRMARVSANIRVRDDLDPAPVIKLESITSSETRLGALNVGEALFGTDDRQFLLRAQNLTATGPGRAYTVIYSATDRAGNKTFAKAYVTVSR